MEDVIEPLGAQLARMPARAGSTTPTAGANFDFYRPVTLIPHQAAAWLIFHERLVELAAHARRLHDMHRLTAAEDVSNALHHIAARIGPTSSSLVERRGGPAPPALWATRQGTLACCFRARFRLSPDGRPSDTR